MRPFGQYGFTEAIRNIWALFWTKMLFPKARLIRRPFYLRGGRRLLRYGRGLTTGYSCRFDLNGASPTLVIGSNCKINDRVHISAHQAVIIGDNVLIGSNVLITDNSHGYYGRGGEGPKTNPDDREIWTSPVTIGDRVWIGEGVSILPGVSIGSGSVIGANAVVSKDVPHDSMAVGTPAVVVKRWDENAACWSRT